MLSVREPQRPGLREAAPRAVPAEQLWCWQKGCLPQAGRWGPASCFGAKLRCLQRRHSLRWPEQSADCHARPAQPPLVSSRSKGSLVGCCGHGKAFAVSCRTLLALRTAPHPLRPRTQGLGLAPHPWSLLRAAKAALEHTYHSVFVSMAHQRRAIMLSLKPLQPEAGAAEPSADE